MLHLGYYLLNLKYLLEKYITSLISKIPYKIPFIFYLFLVKIKVYFLK